MEVLRSIWLFIQNQVLGMKWLGVVVGNGLNALGVDITSRWGGSIQFFIYDVIKIMVLLGIIATSAGKLMGTSSPVWYMILGVLMVLIALQTWDVFNFIPSVNLISRSRKKGYAGAFLAGILGGIFFSPWGAMFNGRFCPVPSGKIGDWMIPQGNQTKRFLKSFIRLSRKYLCSKKNLTDRITANCVFMHN